MASVLAWHFVRADLTPGYGKPVKAVAGQVRRHRGDLALCESGLHASISVLDALAYAPGPIVCRVSCDGRIVHGNDKLVCSVRRVLWTADATDALRAFSRRCASSMLHLWSAPEIVRRYLETGDESIRDAARDAAWSATWNAARDAARDAAWTAARDARDAAWNAAWNAARAAWNAARAARDAARDAKSKEFAADLERSMLALAPANQEVV